MLNRLALVLHWIGLMAGLALLAIMASSFITNTNYVPLSPEGEHIRLQLYDHRDNVDELDALLAQLSYKDLETYVNNNDGVERTVVNWGYLPLVLASLLVPLLIGWAIRFVLSGDNVILPWLKPKDSAQ